MPAPTTANEWLELVRKSELVEKSRLEGYLEDLRRQDALAAQPARLAGLFVRDGLLTHFQAEQLLYGKWRRFTIGTYAVLERLGAGGNTASYLCQHRRVRRLVAVKVLPASAALDPVAVEGFYRGVRYGVAIGDHANFVRLYDLDQDGTLHFVVREFVDGPNLQDLVERHGPLSVVRACHYVSQAASGLHHAHETTAEFTGGVVVHRDVKPGHLLLDRSGRVKILDFGFAHFRCAPGVPLGEEYIGTVDYLAPEAARDTWTTDRRADVYGLGATLYFLLSGRPPFGEGTTADIIRRLRTREPNPLRKVCPHVPEELAVVVQRMMARHAENRYQTAAEVVTALEPWTRTPVPPPPASEMPSYSPAVLQRWG